MATKLNVKALKQVIRGNAVVSFYAPWCGHCKTMSPQLDIVARAQAQAGGAQVRIAKFDYDKYRAEVTQDAIGTKEFGAPLSGAIEGFPTVLLFADDGRTASYNGPRTASGITDAIDTFFGPALSGGGGEKEVRRRLAALEKDMERVRNQIKDL